MTVEQARANFIQAEQDLIAAVTAACPGKHKPVSHQDGKQPWCDVCGQTNWGGPPAPEPKTSAEK